MAKDTSLQHFQEHVFENISRIISPRFMDRARRVFETSKEELMDDIRYHQVSQEITRKTPNSNFLHGEGVLFGFLGFEDGDDPVEELVEYVEAKVSMSRAKKLDKNLKVNVRISMPRARDLNSEQKFGLPWQSGKSWPAGIESGISGLPYFLKKYDGPKSRSGYGLQTKRGALRGVEFKTTDFLTGIFRRFRQRVIRTAV